MKSRSSPGNGGPGEAQAHPAAAPAVPARAQLPAPRERQRRELPVHAAPLQDHEERPESHVDLRGRQELHGAALQLVAADNRPLEALHEERLPGLSAPQAGREELALRQYRW